MNGVLHDDAFDLLEAPENLLGLPYYTVAEVLVEEPMFFAAGGRRKEFKKRRREPKHFTLVAEPGRLELTVYDVQMTLTRPAEARRARIRRIREQDEADLIAGLFD